MNNEANSPIDAWKSSWHKKKEKNYSITDFEKINNLGSGKYGQVYLVR